MEMRAGLALWLRWVAANAAAELIGLGVAFAAGFGVISRLAEGAAPLLVVAAVIGVSLTGAFEGLLAGAAQAWVLRPHLSGLRPRAWIAATAAGAFVAWLLGMIPSTLISLSPQSETAPAAEPAPGVVLLLAGGMGLALGAILGAPQWLVLRRLLPRAGWWIPANMLAWAVGMALIFAGVDLASRGGSTAESLLILAAVLALAGAAVGAIHGAILLRLLAGRARSAA